SYIEPDANQVANGALDNARLDSWQKALQGRSCIGKWGWFHGLDDRSRMSREVHVRFCEGLGLKCPGLLTRGWRSAGRTRSLSSSAPGSVASRRPRGTSGKRRTCGRPAPANPSPSSPRSSWVLARSSARAPGEAEFAVVVSGEGGI